MFPLKYFVKFPIILKFHFINFIKKLPIDKYFYHEKFICICEVIIGIFEDYHIFESVVVS